MIVQKKFCTSCSSTVKVSVQQKKVKSPKKGGGGESARTCWIAEEGEIIVSKRSFCTFCLINGQGDFSEPYRVVFILIRRFWSEYFQSQAPTKHLLLQAWLKYSFEGMCKKKSLLKLCFDKKLSLIAKSFSFQSHSFFPANSETIQCEGRFEKGPRKLCWVLVYLRVRGLAVKRIKGIFLDWCKIISIQLIFLKGKQRQMLSGAEAGHKKNTFSWTLFLFSPVPFFVYIF